MDEDERARILDEIRKLSPTQCQIILGAIATMQAFDDHEAAVRWLERNRDAIRAQVLDAE